MHQYYNVDPKLQKLRLHRDATAKALGVDVDVCRKVWWEGREEGGGAWEGQGYGQCSESGSCCGVPG